MQVNFIIAGLFECTQFRINLFISAYFVTGRNDTPKKKKLI